MTNPPNLIWIALDEKLAAKDMCVFGRLLAIGPLTRRLDRIMARLK